MLHSFVRNYLHITWAVKERLSVFQSNSKIKLKDLLIEKSNEMKSSVLAINVQSEHIHLLIDLPANLCLSDFVQKVKGASSHWINDQKLVQGKFSWQRGYGAFSVSASQIDVLKKYIRNQDEHHRRKSFEEEYNEWKRNYGFFDD
ncbi:REP element-mobilizing transposase RayT [Tangfeifania diversioriginum]|uniref:REP element-mobilizing transposase RayT n=1 Tax=Tangfeifania diversioriginum TaxID=1168035 RepID=A0A1M6EIY4_9BACT|nr:IS200/IS605 family transposase [Tangfeifania diversioriginum]SHI85452.1 REP element-mobilizing transposase RayT [Tangfeifania diversioriginum]